MRAGNVLRAGSVLRAGIAHGARQVGTAASAGRALALGAVVVALAGCGTDPTPASAPATPAPTPSAIVAPTDLPGDPMGMARAGLPYAVVGVEAGSGLDLRAGPGTTFAVVAAAAPLDTVVATGRDRIVEGSGLWFEVTTAAVKGWANAASLALLGGTDDATSRVVHANGDELPEADSMEGLGLAVAAFFTSQDPPSRVAIVAPARVGDLGEVTVDVLGIGDDSVAGSRLVVFGTPLEGGRYALRSVEATTLCSRGVEGELCV